MSSRVPSLCLTAILIAAVACAPRPAADEGGVELVTVEGLGSLNFPNSGSAAAQDPFLRGVLLMHSFEYAPAAAAFREAQEIDPAFALAYWGEAMTYNHPVWNQRDMEAGNAALARYAPTAEERLAKAPTARERGYLQAIEILYGDGDKADQDRAYSQAMTRLAAAYPDDHEALAFAALATLGSSGGTRDYATYMRAAAAAQTVFEANPDHPGAAHYLIHSFDDPVHAPLGLRAARMYSEIAPGASHAQHMTTHIFVAMGMWDDVVSGNIRARDVQDGQRAERGEDGNYCGHYSSWLQYGHLMRSEFSAAEALMDLCYQRMSEDPEGGERGYFASMRARQILDTEDWDLAAKWPVDLAGGDAARAEFVDGFTNAFAAIRQGDAAPARALLAQVGMPAEPMGAIYVHELMGLVAIHDGDNEAGIAHLRVAAEQEDAMPFAFGPPAIVKPTFELLGEALLGLDRFDEAHEAFQRATERTPGRALSVRGLEASAASGG
jgi:tetratricopeptide (TPR) repeat protein